MKKFLFLVICALGAEPKKPMSREELFKLEEEVLLTSDITTLENKLQEYCKEDIKLKENLQKILAAGPKELNYYADILFNTEKLPENFFERVKQQIIAQKENALFNLEEVANANTKLNFIETNSEKIKSTKEELHRNHTLYKIGDDRKTALLTEVKNIVKQYNISPENILKKQKNIKNQNVIGLYQDLDKKEELKKHNSNILGGILTLMEQNKLKLNK
jgi:hypothetical protein